MGKQPEIQRYLWRKEESNVEEGRYMRLENKLGAITYTEYNLEELKIVAAQNIEIR